MGIFVDTYTKNGKRWRKVFLNAIAKLAIRDNEKLDEPRNLDFFHYDFRDSNTHKYLEFLGKRAEDPTTWPNIVYRSRDFSQLLNFKLNDDDEHNAVRMMDLIDSYTGGRFPSADCN